MKKLVPLVIGGAMLGTSICGYVSAQSPPRDLAQEEINRTLVIKFYDRFFNQHQVDEAAKMVAENYRQHNPTVPDGKEPFVSYYRDFFKKVPTSRARIIRSSVDGDIAWLHVHSTNNEKDHGEAVVDIFRVRDGIIVEHWDVIQAVPEAAENNNTMF